MQFRDKYNVQCLASAHANVQPETSDIWKGKVQSIAISGENSALRSLHLVNKLELKGKPFFRLS